MYTALVLDEASHNRLVSALSAAIPASWRVIAHHMTINMGPARDNVVLGAKASCRVVALDKNEFVMAVKVISDVPSDNDTKHVTIAVNPSGGKPFMSNKLTHWTDFDTIELTGEIQEVK